VPLRTIATGRAAAGGVEVGAGVATVGEGVGGVMNGTGVGAIVVPVAGAQADSTAINNAAVTSRRTQLATAQSYAGNGMSYARARLQ